MIQGAGAVKKGGLNLDTRARFGRRSAVITAVTRRGVARPGMAEKKGVTGGAAASVGGDWDVGDVRERAERLTGWPALSVGDARARRGLSGTLGCGRKLGRCAPAGREGSWWAAGKEKERVGRKERWVGLGFSSFLFLSLFFFLTTQNYLNSNSNLNSNPSTQTNKTYASA